MGIILRRARIEDKARALEVEAKATPGLRYLNVMFEHWVHDRDGDFRVAEIDGVLMGIGKFTVMPDGSAWLEALRVSPEAQGKGVGKQFYQHFFAVARERQIPQMRMYTGVRNAASKGLAERFGFRVAATFRGASRNIEVDFMARVEDTFRAIADPVRARDILLPLKQPWAGYMVMNRTFYSITRELGLAWASEGKIYYDDISSSLIVLGARFQADLALHVAGLGGNLEKCLDFAEHRARELRVPKLSCLFPYNESQIEQALLSRGYRLDTSEYIVMEVSVT